MHTKAILPKRICLLIGGLSALAVMAMTTAVPAEEGDKVELKVGGKAPAFKLIGSDGKDYSLEQFKGKKPVILAFFPKAFTGG